MNFNAGITTSNLQGTKAFYTNTLGWRVDFENEFYLLLGCEGGSQISFLLPNHPTQNEIFHPEFEGRGVYITVEVPDVDAEYARIKALGTPIAVELRDEPWGDRHFAIIDPNGIAIDIVSYTAPPSSDSP